MRRPIKSSRGGLVSRTATVPAPVKGINARDSLASMDDEDAVYMVNWWPQPSYIGIRRGYRQHVTGFAAPVESLCAYNTATGTTLFAAAGSGIYDATTAGTVGAAVVSGMTSAYWQHTNFATSGGTYLYMVNGADEPQLYNGTTWVSVDGLSTPAITGVTTTDLIHVTSHKDRLWFVIKNSLRACFLPSLSIGGAASIFDFRSLCKRGGYLMAATTWTLDAGEGMDDHLVFVTSKGEMLVYKGTDATSASTWALVGVWQVAEPVGRRCFAKLGGDVAYLSKSGVQQLSKALVSTGVNNANTLSDRIQPLITRDTEVLGANSGWEVSVFPGQNMLLVNVPDSTSIQHQWAMNTINSAWTRFEGMNARSWELFGDIPYFGGATAVYKGWTGFSDNATSAGSMGANIAYSALQSFNYFGSKQEKHWKLVRPMLQSDGEPTFSIGMNYEFDTSAPTSVVTYGAPGSNPLWGTAVWGAFSWGGGQLRTLASWQHAAGIGYCAALYLKCESKDIEVRWNATDHVFEGGGII
jgi:hypothetical protein